MRNPRDYDDRSDAEKMGGATRYIPVEPPAENRKERRAADKKVRAYNRRIHGGGSKR